MEWLFYLLEANLYLLLFYGFYCLFLQHETFYNSNRYFLLIASLVAFLLPIMQLGFLKPAPVINNALFPPPILYTEDQLAKMALQPVQEAINYTTYLYPIYLFIALCFGIKLGFSIAKIIRLWLKAKKAKTGNVTLIELKEQTTAFSFFNLLFIHPHLAEKETVLKHEMVHIKQKHSLDILFFEILQIICWFNPIFYFIKKDIKLLHEYIADDLSTRKGVLKHEYAMFLIENSFGVIPTPLTNQIFNQSILKRRINMLNKKRTAGWARLRMLLALPLTGAMLCTSTMAFTKAYGYVDLLPEKSETTAILLQEVPQKETVKEQAPAGAPKVKRVQVKFPPPIVRSSKNSFYPTRSVNKAGKVNSIDRRYIVVNGKKVEDNNLFFGVTNTSKIMMLNGPEATKKYGADAKFGAVEITGNNVKWVETLADGPPPPVMEQVKFPPPIVKKDRVKFPPPVVKPVEKNLKAPPAIEERPVQKARQGANSVKSEIEEQVRTNTEKVKALTSARTTARESDRVKIQRQVNEEVNENINREVKVARTTGAGVTGYQVDRKTGATARSVYGAQVTEKNAVSTTVPSAYTIGKEANTNANITETTAAARTVKTRSGITGTQATSSSGKNNINVTVGKEARTIYKIDSLQPKKVNQLK